MCSSVVVKCRRDRKSACPAYSQLACRTPRLDLVAMVMKRVTREQQRFRATMKKFTMKKVPTKKTAVKKAKPMKSKGVVGKKLKHHKKGVFYSPVKKANKQLLRNLEQTAYPEICNLTEKKCEQILKDAGVLPKIADLKDDAWCPVCHHKMKYTNDTLRCGHRGCNPGGKTRLQINNPQIAYTPLGVPARGRTDWSYKALVRGSFAAGVKTPQDTMRHWTGMPEKRAVQFDQDITTALAYTEYTESGKNVFKEGEVDVDTAASGVDRTKKGQTTFKGRLLVAKSRKTKERAFAILPDKVSIKGKKSLTPESFSEVNKPIKKHIKKGAIVMSDGSTAIAKAARENNLPAGFVSHGKYEYVRPVCFSKADLATSGALVRKRPASHSDKKYYTKAGNNSAEGVWGNLSQARARVNKKGRRSGNRAHLNQLAAAYLQRRVGTDAIFHALKTYRLYAQDHLKPVNAYGPQTQFPWLV